MVSGTPAIYTASDDFFGERRVKSTSLRRTSGFGRTIAFLLAGAVLPSSAPAAQKASPPAAEGEEIVISGIRDQLKLIDTYVDGLTVSVSDDPLARYQPGVYCPAVLGLGAARNAQIAARMRAVAAAAGVKPAGPGCRTSALVIFADDKESFLAAFRREHPLYFTRLRGEEPPRTEEEGPAVAWHLVQELDPQGMPVQRTDESGPAIVSSSTGGSRLLSMIQPVVAMSVVVVERRALIGLTATQIADYVLVRTLSDRALKGSDVPRTLTILRALDAPIGTAVPSSLTELDLAYLKGRYSGDPSRYGPSQRAAIRRSMKRAASKRGKEE